MQRVWSPNYASNLSLQYKFKMVITNIAHPIWKLTINIHFENEFDLHVMQMSAISILCKWVWSPYYASTYYDLHFMHLHIMHTIWYCTISSNIFFIDLFKRKWFACQRKSYICINFIDNIKMLESMLPLYQHFIKGIHWHLDCM